jgi:excisionase family DNA binding protein
VPAPLPQTAIEPVVLDRYGAAQYLNIGASLLAELTASGEIPSLKIRSRRLYRRADLDAWLAAKVTTRQAG